MHDVISGRPQNRISMNRIPGFMIPRFGFPFFRRMTNTQAGSHSTAPKATPPVGAAHGQDLRSRNALVFLTGWMVSVVQAV